MRTKKFDPNEEYASRLKHLKSGHTQGMTAYLPVNRPPFYKRRVAELYASYKIYPVNVYVQPHFPELGHCIVFIPFTGTLLGRYNRADNKENIEYFNKLINEKAPRYIKEIISIPITTNRMEDTMKEITSERIRQIAESYRNASKKLTSAIGELRQLKAELTEINSGEVSYFDLFGKRDSGLRLPDLSESDLARYQINLEIGCWRLLISQTGILSKATEDDRNKILQDIENRKLREFTEENIAITLAKLKNQEADCIRNLAKEVFKYFSPNYYQKEPIPRKFVGACSSYGAINFSSCYSPKWEILGKALLILDHQPLPTQYSEHLEQQMNKAVEKGETEFECPYFKAKFYHKSGTAHLTFTRMDLIETINKIGMEAA